MVLSTWVLKATTRILRKYEKNQNQTKKDCIKFNFEKESRIRLSRLLKLTIFQTGNRFTLKEDLNWELTLN